MEDIDQFIGKVSKVGQGLVVFIPAKTAKYAGLEVHDIIKVWFKKQQK